MIAKGMAVTYRAQPKNPVDYFAKWLLTQCQKKNEMKEEEEKVLVTKELKEKHAYKVKVDN